MTEQDTKTEEIEVLDQTEETTEEVNKIPVFRQLSLLVVILLLIFGSSFTPTYFNKIFNKEEKSMMSTSVLRTVTEDTEKDKDNQYIKPFTDITITGKAAYVWDINSQRALYKKNESDQLPLASVTKLMTALVAQELLDEKENIPIDDIAIRQDGNSGLLQGEIFNRLTLSDLTLMSSSNDGAYALALAAGSILSKENPAHSFVSAMNIRAEEIGLLETYFKNPTGLDVSETEGGAYGSARDMAFLMEFIIKNEPDILTFTRKETVQVASQTGQLHDTENTNYYIDSIPGLIGSKTGYTDLAGGNLVVAFDAGLNRPVIVSVLGSTRQDRFTDVLTLVREAQKYVANE